MLGASRIGKTSVRAKHTVWWFSALSGMYEALSTRKKGRGHRKERRKEERKERRREKGEKLGERKEEREGR